MQQPNNKPRVFVSSTIYDFLDLRSALKFWLEELGLEVQMSEYTDFERRPEQGTFESCFSTIEGSDYYVLLVGGRKGSEFMDGVSVTQQEYRVAAELAKQGRIKPVIFVRAEVATALSERRTIGKALEETGVDPAPAHRTASRTLEHPEFVQSFLEEIERTEFERQGGYGPAGTMWYYRFSNFSHLADALRVNLLLQRSVRQQALLANLKWELEENIGQLCEKRGNRVLPFTRWLASTHSRITLSTENVDRDILLSARQANDTFGFWTFLPTADKLRQSALQEVLLSGAFLIFDQPSRRLIASPVFNAMQSLHSALKSYGDVSAVVRSRIEARSALHLSVLAKADASIAGENLLWLYAAHDRMQDVVRLSFALLRYALNPGSEFRMPTLNSRTPLVDEVEKVEADHPKHQEVEEWAGKDILWKSITNDPPISLEDVWIALRQSPVERQVALEAFPETLGPYLQAFRERVAQEGLDAAIAWLQSQPRNSSAEANGHDASHSNN